MDETLQELSFRNTEHLGAGELDRRAIFDLYNVKLTDIETHKVFHDKLSFICIEMPKFKKTLSELQSHQDKWLYALKNLTALENVPDGFRDCFKRKQDDGNAPFS